ncbi:MAG: hypothetical protein P8N76_28325 [Pirellulaceae bacterium]|nr:hypothetical protein [Pirellulaceae bacterium]
MKRQSHKLHSSVPIIFAVAMICICTTHAVADKTLQRRFGPFIGNWTGQSKAFGGFEGTTEEGELEWNIRYRWLSEKTAVEQTWQVNYKSSKKNFSTGTEVIFLDAKNDELKVISFGLDGDVQWSNSGTVKLIKKGHELTLVENTVNGTLSKYSVRKTKKDRNTLTIEMPSRVINDKEFTPIPAIELKRKKGPGFAAAQNRKMTETFFKYLLTDAIQIKPILHDDFTFTYMGKIKDTLVPYGVPYDRESFFTKWLPHIGKAVPNGITLKTIDVIADKDGVAVLQKGNSDAKYGPYNNDYVWVFKFKDGKILSVEEYNSDYLVANRLYGKELNSTDK